jgi:hypothetical protein
VHLYALVSGDAGLGLPALSAAVAAAGEDFLLDPATSWQVSSGSLLGCGIHHSRERCGPRRYVHRTARRITWFDGLPVDAAGSCDTRDASSLAEHWGSLHERLEGQFNVVDADLENESATILMDTLGQALVFAAPRQRGMLVSNSLAVITGLLGASDPDPLGVSSFLALGWCSGESTLTNGIRVLPGGSRHTIARGAVSTRTHYGPGTIPQLRRRKAPPVGELANRMTELMRSAVAGIDRVESALTAGRDSRVMAALLQAAGENPLYFTGGTPDSPDVVIAGELAELLGLRHEPVQKDPASAELDWTRAAAAFMRQNHGLVSLLQLPDYTDLTGHDEALGVKLSGVGGEIGRAGTGPLAAIATNLPVVRRSHRLQSRLLQMKVRDQAGLMTPAARAEIARHLSTFEQERLREGWRPFEIQEAFYVFERVGRWGAGLGRVAGTEDLYSPFCCRPFISYCFMRRPGDRYVEAIHHGMLASLSPELLSHRFEYPLPPQHPRLAGLMAARQAAGLAGERLAARLPRRRSQPASEQPVIEYPFQHAWLEQRLELAREVCERATAGLWEFVSKRRLEELLHGEEQQRTIHQEDLLRVLTVAWHLQRDAAPGSSPGYAPDGSASAPDDPAAADEGLAASSS